MKRKILWWVLLVLLLSSFWLEVKWDLDFSSDPNLQRQRAMSPEWQREIQKNNQNDNTNDDEDMFVDIELDDGTVTCKIITIFECDTKDYIAILPVDENEKPIIEKFQLL